MILCICISFMINHNNLVEVQMVTSSIVYLVRLKGEQKKVILVECKIMAHIEGRSREVDKWKGG